jgi:hypothetical protein
VQINQGSWNAKSRDSLLIAYKTDIENQLAAVVWIGINRIIMMNGKTSISAEIPWDGTKMYTYRLETVLKTGVVTLYADGDPVLKGSHFKFPGLRTFAWGDGSVNASADMEFEFARANMIFP